MQCPDAAGATCDADQSLVDATQFNPQDKTGLPAESAHLEQLASFV
ncbi:MAG: hypothetical protein ACI9TF_000578 [Paracrocinitomix sp.]|jgi:hypothetical protein